ncbi:MAG: hypothetical protein ACE15F_24200 [bacterium]
MSDLILRNVDSQILENLKKTAAFHGTSIEDEAKKILNQVVLRTTAKQSVLERARAIRERNQHLQKTPTLDLLREDRNRP